jgi:hypothetical protein
MKKQTENAKLRTKKKLVIKTGVRAGDDLSLTGTNNNNRKGGRYLQM